ncbi:hypothetical protein IC235_06435 [Hymenobacter sp. BT664]|uniref:Uncharacterized protein n=1 Tax=Hymenobacter montanus TaxID=2771359 RepID=A0A927BB95_9BACT|nr:hypothetical protein [Hymenobacter montanus]MBD2767526.1 hypothetical protein [Hymenobacter montanus]
MLNIPDKEEISIHELGSWKIKEGSWLFSKESFIDYVLSLIKELNPELQNIYTYSQKVVNGVRIGEGGTGTVYKENKTIPHGLFPEKVDGDSVNLFYKLDEVYYLVKTNIFSDGTITLSRLEDPVQLSVEEFEGLAMQGMITTVVPLNARVHIYGLGSFTVDECFYSISLTDKLLQIKDVFRELRGELSTLDICREAHQDYLDNPTADNKEKLRISYEAVPSHHRRYVGDMDVKDTQVRMILYGKQEVEGWSHYQVAQAMGEQLPTINIPDSND